MSGWRAVVVLGLLAGTGGCEDAEEPCHEHAPAFELTVELPDAVKPERVAGLQVAVEAGGFKRTKTYDIEDELDDGETSFVVFVGDAAGAGGFTAEVSVVAEDASGTTLARGEASFEATGDGCNFFEMRLKAPPPCEEGATRACYGGPTGTAGKGACKAGEQTCSGGQWGTCAGEVLPAGETCDGVDEDCDGETDETGDLKAPACARDKGVCAGSTQTCGGSSGWIPCETADYEAHDSAYEETESTCDQKDNDCDGEVDEELFDEDKGCWDLRVRVTAAKFPYDFSELKALGETVGENVWKYGLFGPTDPHVAKDTLPCSGSRKKQYKAKAWVIRRELETATRHIIQVEGNAKQDCKPLFQPEFSGEIEVNLKRGWAVSAKTCPKTLVGSGFCKLDSATGKASWKAGRLCKQCCACPESAAVDLEFVVTRK